MWRPVKLKVLVDDVTAFSEGRNKELACNAEKVLQAMRNKVEEKGPKLSITEGGRHCVMQQSG